MHGGTSPGAPQGNQHALKHGYYSAKAQEERQRALQLIRNLREQIDRIAQLRGVAQVGAGNESLTNSPET